MHMGQHQHLKNGLSVIVPVTNMSGKLANLRSWIEKIPPYSIQIILIHDVRESDTSKELAEIVNSYGENQIQLIEGKFGSPGATRNMGLSSIKFEWVAFWDSDDLPNVDNVMKAILHVGDRDFDCIVGTFSVTDIISQEHKVEKFSANYIDDIGINPGIWRFIFRSNTLASISFVNLLMAEDQVFLANYFAAPRDLFISEEVFYEYYIGSSSQLTRNKKAICDLPNAMKTVAGVFGLENENARISYIFFTRMLLTSLKLGSISCKIYAMYRWLAVFLISSLTIKLSLIRAAWVVFRYV